MKNAANTQIAKASKSKLANAAYYLIGGGILALIPAAVLIAKFVFHVNMDMD